MSRYRWSLNLGFLALVACAGEDAAPLPAGQTAVTDPTLPVVVSTDRAVYTRGEDITITIVLRNTSGSPQTLEALAQLEGDGRLPLRVVAPFWIKPNQSHDELEEWCRLGGERGELWTAQVAKFFVDGVVETGTAWLEEPDSRGDGGRPLWNEPAHYADAVALFAGSATMLSWLFGAHHVAKPDLESEIFFQGVAGALFESAMVWLTYMAIEPIVRRRWPDLLISWSRLLAGRYRDPLVGRDALAGILGGAVTALVLLVSNSLANWSIIAPASWSASMIVTARV